MSFSRCYLAAAVLLVLLASACPAHGAARRKRQRREITPLTGGAVGSTFTHCQTERHSSCHNQRGLAPVSLACTFVCKPHVVLVCYPYGLRLGRAVCALPVGPQRRAPIMSGCCWQRFLLLATGQLVLLLHGTWFFAAQALLTSRSGTPVYLKSSCHMRRCWRYATHLRSSCNRVGCEGGRLLVPNCHHNLAAGVAIRLHSTCNTEGGQLLVAWATTAPGRATVSCTAGVHCLPAACLTNSTPCMTAARAAVLRGDVRTALQRLRAGIRDPLVRKAGKTRSTTPHCP